MVFPQGKFIRINFDVNGYIVGANIETCILMVQLKSEVGVWGELAVTTEELALISAFPCHASSVELGRTRTSSLKTQRRAQDFTGQTRFRVDLEGAVETP